MLLSNSQWYFSIKLACVVFFTVTIYQKEDGKSRNRKIPCFYCGEILFNMKRHLITKHSDENEVMAAVTMKNEEKRKAIFTKISCFGMFNHNVSVMCQKKGTFYVARSSDRKHYVEDYLPCKFCNIFVIKRELYRHCKNCKLQTGGTVHKYAQDGRLLLDGALFHDGQLPPSLSLRVLCKMRRDMITKVVKKDSAILTFGASLLRKLGPKRANDIAQRMRQLARICLRLAKVVKRKKAWVCSLSEFITGRGFDSIIDSIGEECELFEDQCGRQLFRNPNLALKVGHSLLKVAKLKLGASIRAQDTKSKADAEEFIALHMSDFTDLVATPAHASVKLQPRKLDEFPDSKELLALKEYQIKESDRLRKSLICQPSPTDWRQLAEITMSRLLVYNARRGSEVADLRVLEYEKRSSFVHSNVEDNMSAEDRKLIKR